MGRIEVITRTERRRKYSPVERAAIMREADAPDVTVREVAKRHDIAESLIYSWRTARRQAEKIASEPLAFISYGVVPEGDLVTVAPAGTIRYFVRGAIEMDRKDHRYGDRHVGPASGWS